MIFSFLEVFYIILTIVILGLIFSREYNLKGFLFGVKVVGISIALHEIAHKLVAISLGYNAYYQVNIFGLLLGLIFKLLRFPIIFFIPGYVSIEGEISATALSLISIAGPAMNFLLYVLGKYFYKRKRSNELFYFYRINLWLFILNILPVPPLDGFKFIYGVYQTLVGTYGVH